MAGYRKIDPRIWNDEKFRRLPDDGKMVFLFLLTHPSLTSIGAMRATVPGLAAELGWPAERFAVGLDMAKSMIVHIEEEHFIGFPNYLKYNQPQGPNSIIRAWPQSLDLLPEGRGRRAFAANCLEYLNSCSQSMRDAIPDAIRDAIKDAMRHAIKHGNTHGIKDPIPDAIRQASLTLKSEAEAVILREEKNPPVGPPLKPKRDVRHKLPSDFELTPERRDFAINLGLPDPDTQFQLFCDHWRSTAERKADWDATWRNWCRNAAPGGRFSTRSKTGDRIPSLEEAKRDLDRLRRERQTPKAVSDDAF